MVPKVAGKGKSFKGAGAYYLHDKGALTSERVAFAETIGLPTSDPEKAIRLMAYTAMNQNRIKARAGQKATGRKLANPVYAYSLAWAPGETPSPEVMKAAARETLTRLGLDGHEAILVAHNDEPHPHIHVIVNRVHPETGIAAKLSCDRLVLSKWAEAYEKAQGLIRCEQRVINNEKRRSLKEEARNAFVKDRKSHKAAEFYRWRNLRLKEAFERRQAEKKELSTAQKSRRDQLFAEKREAIDAERKRIREYTKNNWRIVFQKQRRERDLKLYEHATAGKRLRHFLREQAKTILHRDRSSRAGFLSAAFQAMASAKPELDKLDQAHLAERKALATLIRNYEQASVEVIGWEYRKKLKELRETERAERFELGRKHSSEEQEGAKRIKDGADRLTFEAEQAFGHTVKSEEVLRQFEDAAKDRTADRPQTPEEQEGKEQAESGEDRSEDKGGRQDDDTDDKGGDEREASAEEDRTEEERTEEESEDRKSGGGRSLFHRLTARFTDKADPRSRVEKFRENADDITRDRREDKGLEREIKPPDPPKKGGPGGPGGP